MPQTRAMILRAACMSAVHSHDANMAGVAHYSAAEAVALLKVSLPWMETVTRCSKAAHNAG